VVVVGALSRGLDDAQREVLEPLTGVGTDLSVTRPIAIPANATGAGAFSQLPPAERRQLRRENREHNQALSFEGLEPGERFARDSFSSTDLSLPASEVARIRALADVEDAVPSLSLSDRLVTGRVPESGAITHGTEAGLKTSELTVSGIDVRKPGLAPVAGDQITRGRYLSEIPSKARDEAVVDLGYARQIGVGVGDKLAVGGKRFEVVGLAGSPLGGEASSAYVELGRLQELSDREGRVTRILVRADSSDAVARLANRIEAEIKGAEVVTAAELGDRVGGSLEDARNVSSKLGTALAIAALLAAFSIAALLTLASIQKRIRELGTLKALGWRQRLVVRQVTAESLAQGALGGLLGAGIGVAGAAIIDAIGPTLEASVAAQPTAASGHFGQGSVITAGSTDVVLGAPVDPGLLLLAVGLAIVGGLIAGAAGGLRVARLRPAEALRSAE
jgi:ABC-type lipoprotein release transport system permease subunit